MKYLTNMLALPVLMLSAALVCIYDPEIVTAHQIEWEISRLTSLGYPVEVSLDEKKCIEDKRNPEVFVSFCWSGNEVAVVGNQKWRKAISLEDEREMVDGLVSGFVAQQQRTRAMYAAVRIATIVVRDKIGVPISEPLASMLPAQPQEMIALLPSQNRLLGVLLASVVFLLCWLISSRSEGR